MIPQHLQLSTNPYLVDQLRFMREQESTHYQACNDYLGLLSSDGDWESAATTTTVSVSPSDRRTMISWSYDIVDACSIPREIATIGASYFDRFMSTSAAKAALSSRREFQLAFIACLIIALKCRAGMQVDADFVSDAICRKLYNPTEIARMEKEVLAALSWRLNGPSCHEFVRGFLELLPASCVGGSSSGSKLAERMGELARERVESAFLEYSSALQSPSSISYAALVTAAHDECVEGMFGVLDRLEWLRNIESVAVLGSGADDSAARSFVACDGRPFEASRSSRIGGGSPRSLEGYGYCVPASLSFTSESSDDHTLYMDMISMGAGDYLSPVCSMVDDSLDMTI